MADPIAQPGVIRYQLTPEAENDLFEIWQYIAADSVKSADRVEAAIYDARRCRQRLRLAVMCVRI